MNRLILIVLIIGVIIVGYYLLAKPQNQTTAPIPSPSISTAQPEVYTSDLFKLKIVIPIDFNAEEKFNTITLKKENQEIRINRNGTNYSNLPDYIKDLSKKNKLSIEEINVEEKNGNQLVTTQYFTEPNKERKTIFIYKDYFVYSISSDTPGLFNEIDEIS